MERTLRIEEMTSEEYRERVAEAPAVLLPLGSMEVMGAHGPLGADYLVARQITPLVARRTGCLEAPAIAYGDTLELADWPGTVCVPANILEGYYYAVAKSYLTQGGAKRLVFLNFHSLNHSAAGAACRRLKHQGHQVFLIDWWKTVGQNSSGLIEDRQNGSGHGGEMITSVVMAVCPNLIRQAQARNETPHATLAYYTKYLMNSGSPFTAYGDFHDYCDGGAWGDISHATPEKGEKLIRRAVDAIAGFLTESIETLAKKHQEE
jgi:creatinine amidohydrolase